jgi:inner membrane protein
MDTVTQAVFGAVIGQVGFQSKLGWRALAAGAALATVPDLDVLGSLSDPLNEWRHHRGVTHSVFFGPVIGPIFGYAIWKSYQWREARSPGKLPTGLSDASALSAWVWLAVLSFLTHPFLDVLTPYGTQLLAPFSDERFAVNAMSIIDPVYTGILALSLIGGWLVHRGTFGKPEWAAHIAGAAIVLSVGWQVYAWGINEGTKIAGRESLAEQGIDTVEISAYPTLFQPWFRRMTAVTDDAVRVGYYSPLSGQAIEWQTFPKEESALIRELSRTMEYRVLERFAMGEIVWRVQELPDGHTRVEAHDLRYLGFAETELSALWGIAGTFNGDNKLIAPPSRFSNRPEPSADIFSVMWVGAFGE